LLQSATCRRFRLIEDDMLCASASSWQWWRRWRWWWWCWSGWNSEPCTASCCTGAPWLLQVCTCIYTEQLCCCCSHFCFGWSARLEKLLENDGSLCDLHLRPVQPVIYTSQVWLRFDRLFLRNLDESNFHYFLGVIWPCHWIYGNWLHRVLRMVWRPSAIHSAATNRGKLMTLVTGKRWRLFLMGDDNEVFMTRSQSTLRQRQQSSI